MNVKHTRESAIVAVRAILRAFDVETARAIVDAALASPVDGDTRTEIERVIADASGNLARAAAQLGIGRRTLQNRMRALGMPPGKSGRPTGVKQPRVAESAKEKQLRSHLAARADARATARRDE